MSHKVKNMKKVILGKTNIEVSRVGMGVLPMGHSQYDLSLEEGSALIRYALSQGITFFDTAEYYDTYKYLRKAFDDAPLDADSHEAFEPHAQDYPIANVVISSKSLATDYDGMMNAIKNGLAELDREYIDIFLMHEVRAGEFTERAGAWQALIDARTQGLVKAIGVSTHHIDTVVEMSEVDDCDVVFALINHKSMGIRKGNDYGTKEEMLDALTLCRQNRKGVYIMKALGGGNLTTDYQTALDYAFSLEPVDSIMIGFAKPGEVDDLVSYLDGRMPAGYNPDVSQKKMMVNQEDCLGCGTCMKACASNAISFDKKTGLAVIDQSRCITCGYCAYACISRAIIMI